MRGFIAGHANTMVACSQMSAVGNPSARYRAFHAVSRYLTDRSMGRRVWPAPPARVSMPPASAPLRSLSRCPGAEGTHCYPVDLDFLRNGRHGDRLDLIGEVVPRWHCPAQHAPCSRPRHPPPCWIFEDANQRSATAGAVRRYPRSGVLAGQPEDQGLDVPAGAWPAALAAYGPGGPAAADDVAVPAQDGVRGDQQPQSVAPRFGDHAEQDREQ